MSCRNYTLAVTILAAALVAIPHEARAQDDVKKPAAVVLGPRVWVTTLDGHEELGRLVSFTPLDLVVRTDKSDVTISRAAVAKVEMPAALTGGMTRGALIGLLSGAVTAVILCRPCSAGFTTLLAADGAGSGAAIGAGLGAMIGRVRDRRQTLFVDNADAPAPARRESQVWVTDAKGVRVAGTLVSFSGSGAAVRLSHGGTVTTIPMSDIRTVEVPRSLARSLWKGAIFGALALSLPTFLGQPSNDCQTTGHTTYCSPAIPVHSQDLFSTPFKIYLTSLGAAVGTGIGALSARSKNAREIVYSGAARSQSSSELSVAPTLHNGHIGLGASMRWQWH
jgi:hypothetical protein